MARDVFEAREVGRPALLVWALLALATACSSEGDANGQGAAGATTMLPDGSTAATGGANTAGGGANTAGVGTSGGTGRGGNATGVGGAIGTGSSGAGTGATTSGGGTGIGGAIISGGRSGGGGASSGAGGGSAGACTEIGNSCDPDTSTCCAGGVCVTSTSADYAGCRQQCTIASDCASNCCIPFANFPDRGFCGDALLCQCAGTGETCGGTRQCCSGFACSTFDGTGALACNPTCTQNSDCSTNCCVKITGTPDSVCLSAKPFCGQ